MLARSTIFLALSALLVATSVEAAKNGTAPVVPQPQPKVINEPVYTTARVKHEPFTPNARFPEYLRREGDFDAFSRDEEWVKYERNKAFCRANIDAPECEARKPRKVEKKIKKAKKAAKKSKAKKAAKKAKKAAKKAVKKAKKAAKKAAKKVKKAKKAKKADPLRAARAEANKYRKALKAAKEKLRKFYKRDLKREKKACTKCQRLRERRKRREAAAKKASFLEVERELNVYTESAVKSGPLAQRLNNIENQFNENHSSLVRRLNLAKSRAKAHRARIEADINREVEQQEKALNTWTPLL